MGVSTQAIIRKGVTIQEIEKVMSKKYKDVKVLPSALNFMYVIFMDGEDHRQLAVSFNNSCERDEGISGVWCSLNAWSNSVEILKYLCETFGGYLKENDCSGDEFYPINYHLYSQGKEFTKIDEFKHKVIKEVGYSKLKSVTELLDEYSNAVVQNEDLAQKDDSRGFLSKILDLPFNCKINKEEEFWFVRWIFMRRKYKNALLEIENLKKLELLEKSELQLENERLEGVLTQLRLDMFPENKAKRNYKKSKK